MRRIGLLSDTHGTIIPQVFDFFKDVDELWHAGDIGNLATAEQLEAFIGWITAAIALACGATSAPSPVKP